MANGSGEERPKLVWTDLRLFADEEGGTDAASRVQRGDGGKGRPIYSIEVGRVHEGCFVRFFRPSYTASAAGVVTVEVFPADALSRVLEKARAFTQGELQRREDEFRQRRQAPPRDERGRRAGSSKGPRRRGLGRGLGAAPARRAVSGRSC